MDYLVLQFVERKWKKGYDAASTEVNLTTPQNEWVSLHPLKRKILPMFSFLEHTGSYG